VVKKSSTSSFSSSSSSSSNTLQVFAASSSSSSSSSSSQQISSFSSAMTSQQQQQKQQQDQHLNVVSASLKQQRECGLRRSVSMRTTSSSATLSARHWHLASLGYASSSWRLARALL
jgi:hypothetical protein